MLRTLFVLRRIQDVATAKLAEHQIDSVSTQKKKTKNALIGVAVIEQRFLLKQVSVIVRTLRTVTIPVRETDPSVSYRGKWRGR